MKRKWLLMATLGLILTVATLVGCSGEVRSLAQDGGLPSSLTVDLNSEQKGIHVSGTGKVTAVPDIAILSLGVSAQAATVGEAQSQAQSAMDMVMTALESNGVAKKDIQTQQFSIQQVTRWDDKEQKEVIIGYRVTNIVTAKVRQVDKAGAVIDATASAGGDLTRINSISFTVDDPAPLFKQARDKAMADARAKAEQLASLGGVKLGKPVYISEGGGYYPTPVVVPMPTRAAMDSYVETQISPGELDITLTVQVHYSINE